MIIVDDILSEDSIFGVFLDILKRKCYLEKKKKLNTICCNYDEKMIYSEISPILNADEIVFKMLLSTNYTMSVLALKSRFQIPFLYNIIFAILPVWKYKYFYFERNAFLIFDQSEIFIIVKFRQNCNGIML